MANEQFTIRLGVNSSGVTTGINSAVGQIQRLTGAFKRTLVGLGIGGLLVSETRRVIELGSAIHDGAGKAGMAVEAFQEFTYAAKQSGVEMEELEGAFKTLQVAQVNAVKGNQELQMTFKRMGITAEELRKLTPEDLFKRVGKGFEKLPASAQSTADAIALMGKSGDKMMFAFRDGFVTAAESANSLGQVISESVINELDEAGDSVDRLKGRWVSNFAQMIAGAIKFGQTVGDSIQADIIWVDTYFKVWRQGGGSRKEAFKEADKAVDEYFKETTDEARKSAYNKPGKKATDASGVLGGKNQNTFAKPDSDALARLGIYRGGMSVDSIPMQQVTELRQINNNLKELSGVTKDAKRTQEAAAKEINKYLSLIGVTFGGGE